jgi:hypothetical protein
VNPFNFTVIMLLTKFSVKDTVQVIDELTGMWSEAVILGFKSDWEVKVKWPCFPSHIPTIITVPQDDRNIIHEARWNIRKWTNGLSASRKRAEEIKATKLDSCLEKKGMRKRKACETNDEIFFFDTETETTKRAWVYINDPFREEMRVWVAEDDQEVPDKTMATIYVAYRDFRAGLDPPQEVVDPQDDDETTAEIAAPPRKRRAIQPILSAPIINTAFEETLQSTGGKSYQN